MEPEIRDGSLDVECSQCGGSYEVSADRHVDIGSWLCAPCSHDEKAACITCKCWSFKTDMYETDDDGFQCEFCAQYAERERDADDGSTYVHPADELAERLLGD